jgi:ABC-type sulfate/molybdate transport systems ATPase subunit
VSDSSSADQALLRCEHLTVRRGKRPVLDDVSVELHAGELVALLGPNGAGKSTLLDALAGALPPAEGRIERQGRVAVALQAPDLARRTALDNVTLALAWWGVPRHQRRDRARAALEALGAGHLAERTASTLSGGERRRVHIARALAVHPDVLLLDEPFAGLDGEARASLLEDASSALRSASRATLVVVHDRAEAWALADRLLILIDGQLVAAGPPRELLEHPPTPLVARFLGFDGLLREESAVIMTRPSHVILDPAGALSGRVTRAVPLEDGVRLELQLDNGHLYAVAPLPAPRLGDSVRVRVDGGVRFAPDSEDHEPRQDIDLAAAGARTPVGTRKRERRGLPPAL